MDLDQSFSGSSLDVSDADPAELLEKFNDIDELDAELFGPPKPSQKTSEIPVKKVVTFQDPIKSMLEKKKIDKSDDWLFANDDDSSGLLGDSNTTASKNGRNEDKLLTRSSIKSLMTPNTESDILKKSAVNVDRTLLTDLSMKDGDKTYIEKSTSPYSAKTNKNSIPLDDDLLFGSYQPTLSTPSDSKKSKPRLRTANTDSEQFFNGDSFSTFHQGTSVFSQPVTQVEHKDKELPSTPSTDVAPSLPSPKPFRKKLNSPATDGGWSSQHHHEVALAESTLSPNVRPLKNVPFTKAQDVSLSSTSGSITSVEPTGKEIQKIHLGVPAQQKITSLQDSYKSDLELLKSAYSSQLELLKSSYHDLKLRVQRDVDSVTESYSARIDVLRSSMQAQIEAESTKECDHQDEIKRLRSLHLQALEECRMDMNIKYSRLQEVHAEEIEAIKRSSSHQRNTESMMAKVDDSTEKLQLLSAKYESAYNAMIRESETVALNNKQLVTVVQNQLAQQQRSTSDMQMQVQQTTSRLEGMISEMNRKFEEQYYAIQSSHGILQSAHVALQEERNQFMQQISLEREHLRKAHRELVSSQSEFQRVVREDHTKLLLEAKNLSSAAKGHEEIVSKTAEQMTQRNEDYEKAMALLNSERIECIKQHAKLEAKSDKLNSQKEYLDEEIKKFNKEKKILQQIQSELECKQHEIDAISRKKRETEADMEKVHDESRRFERETSERMAGIHVQMEELAKQRQLLTKERQALAKERMAAGSSFQQTEIKQPPSPVKQRMMMSHPGSPDLAVNSGLLLWQHTAKKDHSFLEDEQFFLKTVGIPLYGKQYI